MPPPEQGEPFRVLVFSKTAGYRHACIPAGVAALERLAASSREKAEERRNGDEHNNDNTPAFTVDATEDAEAVFHPAGLARYRVLVLHNASGPFLDGDQLEALKGFVSGGGGVVGIHCASTGMMPPASEKPGVAAGGGAAVDGDGWYGRMIGAVFAGHPKPQEGLIRVEDAAHPIMNRGLRGDGRGLESMAKVGGGGDADAGETRYERRWFDEWYNFRVDPRSAAGPGLHVLLSVDEESYEGGGGLGRDHPLVWCQEGFEGGGRAFYTALGHFDAAYEDEMFMGQVLGGILWTAGVI